MGKTKRRIGIIRVFHDAGRLPRAASRRGVINYPHFAHSARRRATASDERLGLGELAAIRGQQGFQYAKSLNPSWDD
jgi:hypothetical protein